MLKSDPSPKPVLRSLAPGVCGVAPVHRRKVMNALAWLSGLSAKLICAEKIPRPSIEVQLDVPARQDVHLNGPQFAVPTGGQDMGNTHEILD